MKKKLATIILVIATVISLNSVNFIPVQATPSDDLAAIQQKLAEIRAQKQKIQNDINNQSNIANQYLREINSIQNQIALLDNQITEKELVINELELQIGILTEEMTQIEAEVVTAEDEIEGLQLETDNRMVDIYMSQKTNSTINLVFGGNGKKDIIKMSVYQSTVQDETNSLLYELNTKKIALADKKAELQQNKQTVEQDKATIEEEKLAIENSKVNLDAQRAILTRKRNESLANLGSTQNFLSSVSIEEQKTLAEQQRLEQIVFDRVNSIPNGTYVTAGTIIGRQGNTGLSTGPHLHFGVKINGGYTNPCSVLPGGVLSNCGSGSGSLQWPMRGSFVLTSPYGWRWGKMHYAIDIASYISDTYIYAAHSGWLMKGFEPCNQSNPICNYGGANYIIICENKNNCNSGKTTLYWHLR